MNVMDLDDFKYLKQVIQRFMEINNEKPLYLKCNGLIKK